MAKDNPEKAAGVQSGLAEKTPIKNAEKQLSKPDADYDGSAREGPRAPKSVGGGFSLK